ncbi:MAG TPA: YihY/virulence factor BrkB family protein [Rhizomicrobium sp.]
MSAARTDEEKKTGALALPKTLYHRFSADRVLAISAGVTFYALLAIFPAIAALVSIYSLFADAKTIHSTIASMGTVLPGGAIQIIGDQLRRLTANSHRALGLAALIGILVSLWSANSGVKAMFDALNIVLKEQEKRSFIRLNAISLAFTIGGLVVALLALVAVVAVPAIIKSNGWPLVRQILDIGRWPVLWACIAVGIALLYRFGPSRNDIPWRWISWGSAFASLLWIGASIGFSWYAANFGTYNKTYGSLGAVVGFMIWIWISAIIVLLGEELNEALERMQRPHRPERPHPLGVPGKASA